MKIHAKGLCNSHYGRLQRHGDPVGTPARPSFEGRLWAKIDKSGDCWIWTGSKDQKGYGQILTSGDIRVRAHRATWELANGPIDKGSVVDHMCYNTSCVNPDHLRVVSNKQNIENRKGEQSNNTSGFRGVNWHKRGKKWMASTTHNGKSYYIGLFSDINDAAEAVRMKRNELHTHNDRDRIIWP